ncbi:MAG: aldo/keto reductase [Halanaeroarchaeum sp.]
METKSSGGATVPSIGFGTYKLTGDDCANAVRDALEMGYRHIDTAEFYDNHTAVGEGIATSSVDREDVFLTTKLWKTNLEASRVHQRTMDALEALGTEYVDLLLVHWPNEEVPIDETMEAMNELQRGGSVRSIGVSNFSVEQVREAMAASATPIVTNQVRYHPLDQQPTLLEFALEEDLLVTAYSPLGKGEVVRNETLAEIGAKYDATAAQVTLRWLVQQPPVVAIPKAATRDHRYENRQVFDFELTDEEMRRIFALGNGTPDDLIARLGA